MNQHDEILKSVRRVESQRTRNNYILLFGGVLLGALTVLSIVHEGPTDWAGAALPALGGIAFLGSAYYTKKATGKTIGLTIAALAAVGTTLMAASLLVTNSSLQMGLMIAALIFVVVSVAISLREVWLLKKKR